MKILIIITSLCILFCSCKNDITPTTYVSGHLYETCGGAPVKNRGLYIYQLNAAIGSNNTNILATGSTDSTGYFRIPYGTGNPAARLELRLEGGNYAVVALPANLEIIDDLKVYLQTTCNLVVKLNVTNPYTNLDTLEIADYRTFTNTKFAGPFVSGTLYNVINFNMLVPFYNGTYVSITKEMGYRINNENWIINSFELRDCLDNEITVQIQ